MILERFPEISALTDEEQEALVLELLESIGSAQKVNEVDPAIVALLEERRRNFLENHAEARSWDEVKAGIRERYRSRAS